MKIINKYFTILIVLFSFITSSYSQDQIVYLDLDKVSQIYVNRGPGSFAGIRNSLSVVKAFHLTHKIDYYCFSFEDFSEKNEVKYENIPKLCDKLKVEKNLINPIYLS